jgi:hypothetical protein
LNDNVASIFTEIFFECVTENHITGHLGCDTTNIKQGLARNFAKTIYDNMPALRTAQVTGRGGELEINESFQGVYWQGLGRL